MGCWLSSRWCQNNPPTLRGHVTRDTGQYPVWSVAQDHLNTKITYLKCVCRSRTKRSWLCSCRSQNHRAPSGRSPVDCLPAADQQLETWKKWEKNPSQHGAESLFLHQKARGLTMTRCSASSVCDCREAGCPSSTAAWCHTAPPLAPSGGGQCSSGSHWIPHSSRVGSPLRWVQTAAVRSTGTLCEDVLVLLVEAADNRCLQGQCWAHACS